MLREYRAPDGRTYRFEEGEQPEGCVLVEQAEKPKPKRRATANKRRTTQNK